MRRAVLWAMASIAVLAGLVTGGATGASTTYSHGYDISWPQCSSSGDGSRAATLPAPASSAFVILGLTHGMGHTANPCLGAQLSWAASHHVPVGAYLVPSYPTSRQLAAASSGPFGRCGSGTVCRLRNDGARQAADALAVMHRAKVPAPMVWVDVEFRHVHPWSKSKSH